MPRVPRDLSGRDLCKLLQYLRLPDHAAVREPPPHETAEHPGATHHLTVPDHDPIKIGTLNNILTDVASAVGITKTVLVNRLFD